MLSVDILVLFVWKFAEFALNSDGFLILLIHAVAYILGQFRVATSTIKCVLCQFALFVRQIRLYGVNINVLGRFSAEVVVQHFVDIIVNLNLFLTHDDNTVYPLYRQNYIRCQLSSVPLLLVPQMRRAWLLL